MLWDLYEFCIRVEDGVLDEAEEMLKQEKSSAGVDWGKAVDDESRIANVNAILRVVAFSLMDIVADANK